MIDTSSAQAVRDAISDLSSVWGGMYMPIIDINQEVERLEYAARIHDVDSLYADTDEGPIGDLLRKPGWIWSGRGPWGPFGEEHGHRQGLLAVRALLTQSTDLMHPAWDPADPADLGMSAIWGRPDRAGVSLASGDDHGPRSVPIEGAPWTRRTGTLVGLLSGTALHVRATRRVDLAGNDGLYVMRSSHPHEIVDFWNLRSYGINVVGVPTGCPVNVVRELVQTWMSGRRGPELQHDEEVFQILPVWGLDRADDSTTEAIQASAEELGLEVHARQQRDFGHLIFPGLETNFRRSFRAEFRPGDLGIEVGIPSAPFRDDMDFYSRGIVAAEIAFHTVDGQDPRLSAVIPPYRRHAALLARAAVAHEVDHARASHEGTVLGIKAGVDQVHVPFVYNQEVMRMLFDDDSVHVAQSDAGRFQSRAADKFGGPYSGMFNQPGVRAALMLAAGKPTGVTLPHLRQTVGRERGGWPDRLFPGVASPQEYVSQQVNNLLYNGVFVPTLRVHCSYCRVEQYVSADQLSTSMACEFCTQSFNLALSHSLARPDWRYRLAAHLRSEQVQALLPALATTSLLSQFRHIQEPPLPHVLGLEVTLDDRAIEVDVAVYVPDSDWAVVLGEVKTSNRIDGTDVANLEFLREKLTKKDVRCLLLFATLKDQFSTDEVAVLRGLVERSEPVQVGTGQMMPNMPLVLVGADLSHSPWSEAHPWRWDTQNYSGLFGTAISSCERNLGLQSYRLTSEGADGELATTCTWWDRR